MANIDTEINCLISKGIKSVYQADIKSLLPIAILLAEECAMNSQIQKQQIVQLLKGFQEQLPDTKKVLTKREKRLIQQAERAIEQFLPRINELLKEQGT